MCNRISDMYDEISITIVLLGNITRFVAYGIITQAMHNTEHRQTIGDISGIALY